MRVKFRISALTRQLAYFGVAMIAVMHIRHEEANLAEAAILH
jgi:hypothetical protein